MYSLDKRQVALIISDVENARITFSHLADELIDHICCEVENEMRRGKNFEEAYELIKQQTGIKVLQKIQENTHYLIDKNYRIMKMTMKITGNVSLAILGLATVMKILHWPGASILLFLGFVVLCLFFFPAAIYTNYKELKVKGPKVLHISILVGGIILMFGILFKVLHWPGAGMLLLAGWFTILWVFLPILLYVKVKGASTQKEKWIYSIGIAGLFIFEFSTLCKLFHWPGAAVLMIVGSVLLVSVFLPMYTNLKFKETGKITGQYLFTIIGTMFFVLFTILLALNVSKDVLGVFVKEENNSAKIVSYLEQKNQKLYAGFNSKSDSTKIEFNNQLVELKNEATKLCTLIDSIRLKLVMAADQIDKQTAKQLTLNVELINNKSDLSAVNNLMIGENNNGLAYLLSKSINSYREITLKNSSLSPNLRESITKFLDTSVIKTDKEDISWEIFNFKDNSVISSIAVLNDIQMRVRMVESQAIQHYISQNK